MKSRLARNGLRDVILALGLILGVASSTAQDAYPNRVIKLVVPFGPGSGPDLVARVLAQELPEVMSQPVVVENRLGVGGMAGTEFVAKSPPNGYTLLLGTVGTHALNLALHSKLAYDPVKDFAPITQVAQMPHVVVISPSIPARSIMEFVAYARARPGQLNVASAGIGTGMHLAYELMRSATSMDLVHVPYKGPAESLTAVVSGDVALSMPIATAAVPMVKAGRVRALAVTSSRRLALLPDVPTMEEAGFPGFNLSTWYGLFAPAGTPAPVVRKLNEEVVRVLARPNVLKILGDQGAVVIGNTPEEFATTLGSEIARWSKVVKDARLKIE